MRNFRTDLERSFHVRLEVIETRKKRILRYLFSVELLLN